MEFLDSVKNFLMGLSTGQWVGILTFVLAELTMRVKQTEKPMSFMYLVAAGAKKVGDIAYALAAFLDKVLPQRLK